MTETSETMLPQGHPIEILKVEVAHCRQCPRLVDWREKVAREKRKQYQDEEYWGRAVPSFGDPNARFLIVGLAPAAHGANRTGRMFTGDRSGDWLYRALYKAGFANQPTSCSANDGLILTDCLVTATGHCAPPKNKLTAEEIRQCRPFLVREFQALENLQVVLALGKIGFESVLQVVYEELTSLHGVSTQVPKTQRIPKSAFAHGAEHTLPGGVTLLASYHPSQQNTFTGKLTEPMFDGVFERARMLLAAGCASGEMIENRKTVS